MTSDREAHGDHLLPFDPFADGVLTVEEMAAIEEFAVDVLRSIAAGVLSIDGEGQVGVCNRMMAGILGLEIGDIVRRPLREVWPALDRAGLLAEWVRVIEENGYWETEAIEIDVPVGGPKHLEMKVHPLLSGEGGVGGALAIVGDVTEKIRLREENARRERLSLVGRMAAGIIHDFKNPMTIIKGFMPLLERDDLSAAERQEYAGIVSSEVDRMVEMTQDVLDYSRGRPTALDLKSWLVSEFVTDVARVLERELSRDGVELETEVKSEASIEIDAGKMKRAFLNIAFNARDAMRGGGRFTIEAGDTEAAVKFSLEDTGPGIPEEVLDRVFQPFVTAGKPNGTGLGLAITKQIVEGHGGTIAVESEVGEGARFVITLQRA